MLVNDRSKADFANRSTILRCAVDTWCQHAVTKYSEHGGYMREIGQVKTWQSTVAEELDCSVCHPSWILVRLHRMVSSDSKRQ